MLTLEARRVYLDACLLHNIIHNPTLAELRGQLDYRDSYRPNRLNANALFSSTPVQNSYGLNVNPITRTQSMYNRTFSSTNIRNIDVAQFKGEILRTLLFNQSLHWQCAQAIVQIGVLRKSFFTSAFNWAEQLISLSG